jgi:hypothetical protein
MQPIAFIQYLRPTGFRKTISIDRPSDIAAKADEINAAGFRLECETLTTGHVSLTIADPLGDYAIEVCGNDEAVPLAVDRLISEFDIGRAIERRQAMEDADA